MGCVRATLWPLPHTSVPSTSSFRLLRIFRILRLVGFLERLNLLVRAFFLALKSVAWVAVLLVLLLYTCAILAQGFFGDSEALQREVCCVLCCCVCGVVCCDRDCDCGVCVHGVFGKQVLNGEFEIDVYDLFGTVPRAMATLVQVMTFDSWMSVSGRNTHHAPSQPHQ